MSLQTIDAQEFRRQLAGLSDTAGGEDVNPEQYRELAADTVFLLAICFNRQELDATTLWTRIESAIKRGLEETSGGSDLERFLQVALDHVLTKANVLVSDTPAAIHESLLQLDDEQRVQLLVYLAAHLYPAIIHGRKKWNDHKELRSQLARLEEGGDA